MVIGLCPEEWPLLLCQEFLLFLPKIWCPFGDTGVPQGSLVSEAMEYLWISSPSGLVLRMGLRVLGFQGQNRQLRVRIRTLPVVVLISSSK